MATSKAELLASARKKGQKQQIFRRGRGTTTSVRQPAVKAAGKDAKAVSDFLGTMLKFGPGVLDAHNRETNEENKKMVAKGEAAYKNATPIQRKQFRDNIRNGTISGGESPYFREGLKRSQADAMALEYGNEVMMAWESSEAKNSADPEAFTSFLDEFQHKAEGPPGQNRSWIERVGDLGDHVANEEFQPKADAIKRQLMQMHSEHQRSEYNIKAQDTKQTSEYLKLNSINPGVVAEQKVDEKILDDLVLGRRNILNSNMKVPRIPRDTSTETKFINNYVQGLGPRKYRSRQEGKKEWDRKVSNISASLDHLIKTEIGEDGAKKVFSLAAFKKEDRQNNSDDLKRYRTRSKTEVAKTKGKDTPRSFAANMKIGFTPTEIAEIEQLGLVAEDQSLPGLAPSLAPQVALTSGGYSKTKGIAAKDQSLPSLAPSLAHEQSPQVALTQEDVNEDIAIANAEPQDAPDQEEALVQVAIQPDTEPNAQSTIVKVIGGIEPKRNHFGLIAYKTEDEAQLMVDKIRDGIVGDKTGGWEFAIIKVGNVYQVQTQGNTNLTDEQTATFFNKLQSEYPGEMGNLKAGVKDKDYVQVIKGK